MKTKHIALLLMVGTLMSLPSCNYLSHKSIAKRHLDKIGLEICDTVTIHDTTVVTESRTDTVLSLKEVMHDTVIIREGQSEVKYFYNTHDSTIYIEGKCHDTTIVVEREGQTNVVYKSREYKYEWYIYLLAGAMLGFILWAITKLFLDRYFKD